MRHFLLPRWIRRGVIDPIWVPFALLLIVVFALVALLSCVVLPLTPRRRVLRLSSYAVLYLAMDVAVIVACFGLWLRAPLATLPNRRTERWQRQHEALLRWAVTKVIGGAQRCFGFRLALEEPPDASKHCGQAPRHRAGSARGTGRFVRHSIPADHALSPAAQNRLEGRPATRPCHGRPAQPVVVLFLAVTHRNGRRARRVRGRPRPRSRTAGSLADIPRGRQLDAWAQAAGNFLVVAAVAISPGCGRRAIAARHAAPSGRCVGGSRRSARRRRSSSWRTPGWTRSRRFAARGIHCRSPTNPCSCAGGGKPSRACHPTLRHANGGSNGNGCSWTNGSTHEKRSMRRRTRWAPAALRASRAGRDSPRTCAKTTAIGTP